MKKVTETKDLIVGARELIIELRQDRTSALCKAVTHKVVAAKTEHTIASLCDEVERLREQWNTRFNTLCGNCGKRYLGPRDEHLHGYGICNVPTTEKP